MSRARKSLLRAVALPLLALTAPTLVGAPAQAAPDTDPHGPDDAIPSASVVLVEDDALTIFAPRSDGGGSIVFYHTPPGRAKALLTQLRARGVLAASVPARIVSAAVAPPAEGDPVRSCGAEFGKPAQFGGATWFGNPTCTIPIRWRPTSGFTRPQVYFRDHTPARWPVRASVERWNSSDSIDSWWTTSTCPSGRHCVHVWNANYDADWDGRAWIDYDSSFYFKEGGVVVHLNDRTASAEDNRGTACHELGHALGLGHHTYQISCMYPSELIGTDPQFPHSTDMDVLRFLY